MLEPHDHTQVQRKPQFPKRQSSIYPEMSPTWTTGTFSVGRVKPAFLRNAQNQFPSLKRSHFWIFGLPLGVWGIGISFGPESNCLWNLLQGVIQNAHCEKTVSQPQWDFTHSKLLLTQNLTAVWRARKLSKTDGARHHCNDLSSFP